MIQQQVTSLWHNRLRTFDTAGYEPICECVRACAWYSRLRPLHITSLYEHFRLRATGYEPLSQQVTSLSADASVPVRGTTGYDPLARQQVTSLHEAFRLGATVHEPLAHQITSPSASASASVRGTAGYEPLTPQVTSLWHNSLRALLRVRPRLRVAQKVTIVWHTRPP